MNKQALKSVAHDAAQMYLDDGENPTDAVEKQAERMGLTDEQTQRVAHYTNQKINSTLMEKDAYTDFPLADPEKIDGAQAASEKVAFVPDVEDPQEKTASEEEKVLPTGGGLFSKIADLYGATYVPSPDAERDARSMMKAAEVVANEAMADLKAHQRKLAESRQEMYEEVKKSLHEGTDIEEVISGLKERDTDQDIVEYILNRLEADGMVPTSTYEDGGPYSEERRHLKRGRALKEDSPLAEATDDVETYRKHAALDAQSAVLAIKVAANAPEIAGADPSALQEKQAGIFGSIGRGAKSLFKGIGKGTKKGIETLEDTAKGVGKWVGEDPLLRSMELGLGGYAGGRFIGNQKNDMTKQKQQFA